MNCTCPNCGQSFDLLKHSIQEQEKIKASTESILDVVCRYFDITRHDLTSGTARKGELVARRSQTYWLLKKYAGIGPTEISRLFKKNHATILHALDNVESYTAVSRSYRMDLARLNSLVQETLMA